MEAFRLMHILQLCNDSCKVISTFLCLETMHSMIFVCRHFKNQYLKFWACEQTWIIENYLKSKMQRYIKKLKKVDFQINLPLHLSHLTCGSRFNQVIAIGVLPPNLSYLTFGFCFYQVIDVGVLPPNLSHLTFGDGFNQKLANGVLPLNLSQLTFGYEFNQVIEIGVLPCNLSHLTFESCFNQVIAIGVLPPKLSHLTLLDIVLIKLLQLEYYLQTCRI